MEEQSQTILFVNCSFKVMDNKRVVLVLFSVLALAVAEDDACGSLKCQVRKHYEELKCEPVLVPDECCPKSFNCDSVLSSDQTKCHFKGVSYNDGDVLPDDVSVSTCLKSCVCKEGNFTCAPAQCETKADCVNQFKLGDCCNEKSVCEKEEIEKLHVCYYDNVPYKAGERMLSESGNANPCYYCVCDEKFDNATAVQINPNCKLVECGIELAFLPAIQRGCAPIYASKRKCCPFGVECPIAENKADITERKADNPEKATCKFGELTLEVGDKVVGTTTADYCQCIVPPLVTCQSKV